MRSTACIVAGMLLVLVGAVLVLLHRPEAHTAVLPASPGPNPTVVQGPPTCTGQDLDLVAKLRLSPSRTQVVASFTISRGTDTHCLLRRAIPISLVVYSEHGPVRIRDPHFDPTPLVLKPLSPGIPPASLAPRPTTIVQRPKRDTFCATGGHRFQLVVLAPPAAAGSDSAQLCP